MPTKYQKGSAEDELLELSTADDVLLREMQNLHLKNANIFILTFDRELKERFTQEVDKSNNLYILGK